MGPVAQATFTLVQPHRAVGDGDLSSFTAAGTVAACSSNGSPKKGRGSTVLRRVPIAKMIFGEKVCGLVIFPFDQEARVQHRLVSPAKSNSSLSHESKI